MCSHAKYKYEFCNSFILCIYAPYRILYEELIRAPWYITPHLLLNSKVRLIRGPQVLNYIPNRYTVLTRTHIRTSSGSYIVQLCKLLTQYYDMTRTLNCILMTISSNNIKIRQGPHIVSLYVITNLKLVFAFNIVKLRLLPTLI